MKKQIFIGYLDGTFYYYDDNFKLPMDDAAFDCDDYSKCPHCGAFNEYELDGDTSEIDEVECGNCDEPYNVVISFSWQVEAEEDGK